MEKHSLRPYFWMLCGSFSFAWMGQFTREAGRHGSDWRLVALARGFLVLVFALALARAAGSRLVFWKPTILWVRSLAGSISLLCTFYALNRLPTAEVISLTNTFPIWVAVLSWPLLGERPSGSVWLAGLCGVLGTRLILQPHFDQGNFAVPVALTAALATAVAMLGLHRLRGLDAWAIVVHFSGVATLCTAIACLLDPSTPWSELLDPTTLALLAGIGATATAGQLMLTLAFAAGPPARVSVVALTQVVFALALDRLFGEAPASSVTLAGIGLVVAPTAWVMTARAE